MTEPNHSQEKCLAFFTRLSEYLDNELDLSVCQSIEQHLAHCPACQVCVATLKRTIALCRKSESSPVPDEVSQRLKAYIQNLRKTQPR